MEADHLHLPSAKHIIEMERVEIRKRQEAYINFFLDILVLQGLSPSSTNTPRWIVLCRKFHKYLISFLFLIQITALQPLNIYFNWSNKMEVIESIILIQISAMYFTFLLVHVVSGQKVRDIAETLEDMLQDLTLESVMCIEETRMLGILMTVVIYVFVIVNVVTISTYYYFFVAQSADLQYGSLFPFDKTGYYGNIMACVTEVTTIMLFWEIVVWDMLSCTIQLQINMHFRIVQHQFQNIFEQAKRNVLRQQRERNFWNLGISNITSVFGRDGVVNKRSVEKEIKRLLGLYVEQHVKLDKLLEETNDVYAFRHNCQIIINLTSVAVIMVFIVWTPGVSARTIVYAIVLFMAAVQWMVLCSLATNLYEESSGIVLAVYCSDWLEASLTTRKSMCIIMTAAQRPRCLRAFGYVPLSLQLFTDATSRAYKFLNVIRAAHK